MPQKSRREFFLDSLTLSAAVATSGLLGSGLLTSLPAFAASGADSKAKMKLGLVTYLWGAKWSLPEIISTLEKSGVLGVELRTTHAHGVEIALDAKARADVKQRFDDSPAILVGIGSNERFDDPNPVVVKQAIEKTKAFLKLSHDVGSTGVKVKPNSFHKGVDHDVTIAQIGQSLNTIGKFAADYGQQVRLEVHGSCQKPAIIKKIMEHVDQPSVRVCWNSNPGELQGKGLEYNFNLIKDYFGDTVHIRELDYKKYPFEKLVELLATANYGGWLLIEAHSKTPQDPIATLRQQNKLLKKMLGCTETAQQG